MTWPHFCPSTMVTMVCSCENHPFTKGYHNLLSNKPLNFTGASESILKNMGKWIALNQYSTLHYNDVIMSAMAYQITSLAIVYSTVYSGAYQSKHQSSVSLAFVRGIHRWPVNSPHKWPVTRKMFPFDDVIMMIKPQHNKAQQNRVYNLRDILYMLRSVHSSCVLISHITDPYPSDFISPASNPEILGKWIMVIYLKLL